MSEIFPLEIRALAISLFYAFGTLIRGVGGPSLFGALIDTGSRVSVFGGYLLGASLIIAAGLIAWFFAVSARNASHSNGWRVPSGSWIELLLPVQSVPFGLTVGSIGRNSIRRKSSKPLRSFETPMGEANKGIRAAKSSNSPRRGRKTGEELLGTFGVLQCLNQTRWQILFDAAKLRPPTVLG